MAYETNHDITCPNHHILHINFTCKTYHQIPGIRVLFIQITHLFVILWTAKYKCRHAYLFCMFCHPEHTSLGPALKSILGSNATLYVNWAYCGVSRLVLAVAMLYFLFKIKRLYMFAILFLSQLPVWGKSFPCTFFWPCTYINFPTMGHTTLVFRPAHNEFSDNVPPYTCVCPTHHLYFAVQSISIYYIKYFVVCNCHLPLAAISVELLRPSIPLLVRSISST